MGKVLVYNFVQFSFKDKTKEIRKTLKRLEMACNQSKNLRNSNNIILSTRNSL